MLYHVSADDGETEEYYKNNRNLHFKSPIIEISAITEFYLLTNNWYQITYEIQVTKK